MRRSEHSCVHPSIKDLHGADADCVCVACNRSSSLLPASTQLQVHSRASAANRRSRTSHAGCTTMYQDDGGKVCMSMLAACSDSWQRP